MADLLNLTRFYIIRNLLFIIILLLLNINFNSAIRINEIMYAPPNSLGGAYNEWLEIFCDINIENLKVIDYYGLIKKETHFNCSGNLDYILIVKKQTEFCKIYDCSKIQTVNGSISLKNDKDDLWIYQGDNLIDSVSYESSQGADNNGNSLQFISDGWKACSPTPGEENYCASTPIPTPAITPTPAQTATPTPTATLMPSPTATKINRSVVVDFPENIYNNKEFNINLTINNFEKEYYDVKIAVLLDKKIISDIYDNENRDWKSSNYYLLNVMEGKNNAGDFLLRIKEKYKNYSGSAIVSVRIRKNGGSLFEEYLFNIYIEEKKINNSLNEDNKINREEEINIENKEEANQTIELIQESKLSASGNVIQLNPNSKSNKETILYKSPNEKIKLYSMSGFVTFCLILLLIALTNWRKREV